jgi:hypothetical protein
MTVTVDEEKLRSIRENRVRFLYIAAACGATLWLGSFAPAIYRQFRTRRVYFNHCRGRVLDVFPALAGHDRVEMLETTKIPVIEVLYMGWSNQSPLASRPLKDTGMLPNASDLTFAIKNDARLADSAITFLAFDESKAAVGQATTTQHTANATGTTASAAPSPAVIHTVLMDNGLRMISPEDAQEMCDRIVKLLDKNTPASIVVVDMDIPRDSLLGKATSAFRKLTGSALHLSHDISHLFRDHLDSQPKPPSTSAAARNNSSPRLHVVHDERYLGLFREVVFQTRHDDRAEVKK